MDLFLNCCTYFTDIIVLKSSVCMLVSCWVNMVYHSMVLDRDTCLFSYTVSAKEVRGKHLGWKNDMGEVGKRHKNRKVCTICKMLVVKQTRFLPLCWFFFFANGNPISTESVRQKMDDSPSLIHCLRSAQWLTMTHKCISELYIRIASVGIKSRWAGQERIQVDLKKKDIKTVTNQVTD